MFEEFELLLKTEKILLSEEHTCSKRCIQFAFPLESYLFLHLCHKKEEERSLIPELSNLESNRASCGGI